MSGCDADVASLVRQAIYDVNQSTIEDEDIFDYLVSVISDDTFEFGENAEDAHDTLGPLLIDAQCASDEEESHRLCKKLQEALEAVKIGSSVEPKPLDQGPVLLDDLNKIQLHPHDEKLSTGGKNAVTKDFSLMSEKDAIKLQKQEEKAMKSRKAAMLSHQKELERTLQSKAVRVVRHTGGPTVRDVCLENINVSNKGTELISDCDITLAYGRKYGLVGRNGTGKTTFLRAFAAMEISGVPWNCQVLHVEQEIVGDDTPVIDAVLQCDQERLELLEEMEKNPEDEAVMKRLHEIDAFGAEARAAMILAGLQFTPDMQKVSTASLSGGWRMRVALARALFVQPDILLLDEPTNHLDLHAVLWLEEFLAHRWPKTVVIVSHAREFLNTVCTDIIHLYGRKLTPYRGNYDVFLKTMEERLKNEQVQAESISRKKAHMQAFVDKFRYNAKRASLVQSRIKQIQKLDGDAPELLRSEEEEDVCYNFIFPLPEDANSLGGQIISFNDVCFKYDTQRDLFFENLSFGIDLSSRIVLVGSNGIGKSTLLNLISGTLEPTQGHIFRNPKVRIAVFSQHHVDGIDLSLTPLQYMKQFFPSNSISDSAAEEKFRSHLASFGIDRDLCAQPAYTLSGGQKSRVALSKITWEKPHILLLDEPSNHLDIDSIDAMLTGLHDFSTHGGGILMISHDQYLIESFLSSDDSSERPAGQIWHVTCHTETSQRRHIDVFPGSFQDYKKSLYSAASS